MYNPYGASLIIDSLKGQALYKSLEQYNILIDKACANFSFTSNTYDVKNNQGSFWFDPRCVRDLAISHVYPKTLPVQKDKKFCLTLYAPNYFSLLLINTLYDNKDILIEEQAGGMGALLMYLNKLGYNNFNMIDNFTQLPKKLYDDFMVACNINPKLNDWECIPNIVNLIGYTYFIKPIKPETELVICYNNTSLMVQGDRENIMFRDQCLEKYSVLENKVWLASDKYGLANAYCNKDKLEEFYQKLEKYQ